MILLRMPPDAIVSHATAAQLHRIPIPRRLEADARLHISVPAPARAPHATNIAGHSLTMHESDVEIVRDIRRTSPERTWCDLAGRVSFPHLVAAGDALIHWRAPMTTVALLAESIDMRVSRRGIRLMRRALGSLNERAESPPESIVRVLLEGAGLGEVLANHVITDEAGAFVARVDLAYPAVRVIIEYQGDYHRSSPGQWRSDLTRRSRLEALGWRVVELGADDLQDPAELVSRIRRLAFR